jgi:hypothetical protein
MISPFETPLLAALGDAPYPALFTKHEWLEDALNAVTTQVSGACSAGATAVEVDDSDLFSVGDLFKIRGADEVLLVTAINGSVLNVTRGYGGSTASSIADDAHADIIGNAALEGDDAPSSRETLRQRIANYTQILTKTVLVTGTEAAVSHVGIQSEYDYQLANRLREALRDLENTVINGASHAATPQGSDSVRRSMKGIISFLASNVTDCGGSLTLTETRLNDALRSAWENGASNIDLIVVNGYNKRKISSFVTPSSRYYLPQDERFKATFGVYESDFGIQRVVLSRWCPPQDVLLLDSNRIKVLPLKGRSFFHKPLESSGDYHKGEIIGEYTLELRNEAAHARLKNLSLTA